MSDRDYYARAVIKIESAPSITSGLLHMLNVSSLNIGSQLGITSARRLILGATQGATVLNVGQIYTVEVRKRRVSATDQVQTEVRLDGVVEIATATEAASGRIPAKIRAGVIQGSGTPTSLILDQLAVNDNQGASENTWPGVPDTEPPQDPAGSIDEGAVVASPDVNFTVTTSDPDTTGYEVLIWGDVDDTDDPAIQTTEGASSWKPWTGGGPGVGNKTFPVKLSPGSGNKTVTHKIKDPAGNETPPVTTDVELDVTAPVVTIDAVVPGDTIVAGSGTQLEVQTTSSEAIQGGEVWVVADAGDGREGTMLIDDSALSGTSWNPVLTEALLLAAALTYGDHIVKVFVQDEIGNWSSDAASPSTVITYEELPTASSGSGTGRMGYAADDTVAASPPPATGKRKMIRARLS